MPVSYFDTQYIAQELTKQPLVMKLRDQTKHIQVSADSYLTFFQESVASLHKMVKEEYETHKSYKQAVESVQEKISVIGQRLTLYQEVVKENLQKPQTQISQMKKNINDKLVLAKVTLDYLQKVVIQPQIDAFGLRYQEKKEHFTLYFS